MSTFTYVGLILLGIGSVIIYRGRLSRVELTEIVFPPEEKRMLRKYIFGVCFLGGGFSLVTYPKIRQLASYHPDSWPVPIILFLSSVVFAVYGRYISLHRTGRKNIFYADYLLMVCIGIFGTIAFGTCILPYCLGF